MVLAPVDFHRLRWAQELQPRPTSRLHTPSALAGPDLLERDVHDHGVAATWEAILLDAVAERATDIHLEIYRDGVHIRLRIDGDLIETPGAYGVTPAVYPALINVVKVAGKLDLAQRRAPQGGRSRVRVASDTFDLRIQTQPAVYGEHAVIRVLPQDAPLIGIAGLGFPEELAIRYRRILAAPSGLILVVGPTASGKTTTLYAGLQLIVEDPTRKIITVEDPVEYVLDGVQQCQVLPEVGFTFASAMRSFVRQDPDVIVLGEIRDSESALEALRASETGHLVLATLHCNDTIDAVQPLLDLGMHPNSLASELMTVLSQRLAKRICTRCSEPATAPEWILRELFPAGLEDEPVFFRGRGCDYCRGTGNRGRIAVVEYLPVDGTLRREISRGSTVDDLRAGAHHRGVKTLRDQALDLASRGIIALEELPVMLTPEALAGHTSLQS